MRGPVDTERQTGIRRPGRPSGIRLSLLDGFELTFGSERVEFTAAIQRLVAFLALNDRPLKRSHVAGTLWLESSDERANASLRSALWRLRQPHLPLIQSTSTHLTLHPSVSVDLRDARALALDLINGSGAADGESAASLSADLLPDWYDEWVLLERERFRQLRLRGLECLCYRLATVGKFAQAVEAGLLAVGAEPLRESARRALINTYVREGNWGEAVRQLRSFALLLREELGVEPSAGFLALIPGARYG